MTLFDIHCIAFMGVSKQLKLLSTHTYHVSKAVPLGDAIGILKLVFWSPAQFLGTTAHETGRYVGSAKFKVASQVEFRPLKSLGEVSLCVGQIT
jgi:hypothetical protein